MTQLPNLRPRKASTVKRRQSQSISLAGMLIVAIATIWLVLTWSRDSADKTTLTQISPLPQAEDPFDSPIETPTPEVFPTITPVPTLPFVDKLPPGEKIIYTETDETLRSTLVQISNVENLEVRRRITTIPHLFGYKPIGLVSPDRTRVAFLVKPDATRSSRDSSTFDDSQLWIVEINDGTTRILADNVSFIAGWVTNQEVAFARMSSPVSSASADVVHPEFYTVTLDGSVQQFLTGGQTGEIVHPVGWSQNGKLFYLAKWETMPGAWEIWEVDNESRQIRPILKAMSTIAESPVLSTNGRFVLYNGFTDSEQLLIITELASGNTNVLSVAPKSSERRNTIIGIPSLIGEKVLIRSPLSDAEAITPASEKASLQIAVYGSDNQPSLSVTPVDMIDDSFAPVAWSPSEQWIAMTTLPGDPSILLVYSLTRQSWRQIPKAYPSNWISILGWQE